MNAASLEMSDEPKINLLFECLRGNLNQFNRASFGIGIGQKPPMTERDAVNLTL